MDMQEWKRIRNRLENREKLISALVIIATVLSLIYCIKSLAGTGTDETAASITKIIPFFVFALSVIELIILRPWKKWTYVGIDIKTYNLIGVLNILKLVALAAMFFENKASESSIETVIHALPLSGWFGVFLSITLIILCFSYKAVFLKLIDQSRAKSSKKSERTEDTDLTGVWKKLFPGLFRTVHIGMSKRLYETTVLNQLDTQVQSGLKKAEIEFRNSNQSMADYKKWVSHMQDYLAAAWESGEKEYSRGILDGTVDSFPRLLVSTGQVMRWTKTTTFEDEDSYTEKQTELVPFEVEVDYFKCALTSLEFAEDPTSSRHTKPGREVFGEGSAICEVFKKLYSEKNRHEKMDWEVVIFMSSCALGLLVLWMLYLYLDWLIIKFIFGIAALILIPRLLIFVLGMLNYWLNCIRLWLHPGKRDLRREYSDAKKLLYFYELWEEREGDDWSRSTFGNCASLIVKMREIINFIEEDTSVVIK